MGVVIHLDSAGTGGGGGIPEAPLDGQQYGRQSASWTAITGGGTSNYLYTKTLWVDANATPATGVKGDFHKPFLYNEAIAAAVSGDVIVWMAGTYTVTTNIAKNGVTHIADGNVIINTTAQIINDSGGAVNFKMYGDFTINGTTSPETVDLTNSDTVVDMHITKATSTRFQFLNIDNSNEHRFSIKEGDGCSLFIGSCSGFRFNLGTQHEFIYSDRSANDEIFITGNELQNTGNLLNAPNSDLTTSIVEFHDIKLVSGRNTILKRAWIKYTMRRCVIIADGSDGLNTQANCIFTSRPINHQPVTLIDCQMINLSSSAVAINHCIYWTGSSGLPVRFIGSNYMYMADNTSTCMESETDPVNIEISGFLISNVNSDPQVSNIITSTSLIIDSNFSIV
jgi:hypothetical protein